MHALKHTKILASTPARLACLLLAVQCVAFYSMPTEEYVPQAPPLENFSRAIGNWQTSAEGRVEKEIMEVLKADDTLTRTYHNVADGRDTHLFVAFFKTQRAGVSPHSPKVCLPGSGWMPERTGTVNVQVPGGTIPVNRYIVSRGDQRSLVLYWYQTAHRAIANEYAAKLYLMVDGVRYRRSDASLVRVIVPVVNGDEDRAFRTTVEFIQALYTPLRAYLPA